MANQAWETGTGRATTCIVSYQAWSSDWNILVRYVFVIYAYLRNFLNARTYGTHILFNLYAYASSYVSPSHSERASGHIYSHLCLWSHTACQFPYSGETCCELLYSVYVYLTFTFDFANFNIFFGLLRYNHARSIEVPTAAQCAKFYTSP